MKKIRSKSGMTLIETIVAFAIISVIIVVAVMSINTIAGVNVKAQDLNVADQELEKMIAEWRDWTIEPGNKDVTIEVTIDGQKVKVLGDIYTFTHNDRTIELFRAKPANGT